MVSSNLELHRYATGRKTRVNTAMTLLKSHLFRYVCVCEGLFVCEGCVRGGCAFGRSFARCGCCVEVVLACVGNVHRSWVAVQTHGSQPLRRGGVHKRAPSACCCAPVVPGPCIVAMSFQPNSADTTCNDAGPGTTGVQQQAAGAHAFSVDWPMTVCECCYTSSPLVTTAKLLTQAVAIFTAVFFCATLCHVALCSIAGTATTTLTTLTPPTQVPGPCECCAHPGWC